MNEFRSGIDFDWYFIVVTWKTCLTWSTNEFRISSEFFLVILRDMCNRDSIKRLTLDLKFQLEYLTWIRFQVTTWYLILLITSPSPWHVPRSWQNRFVVEGEVLLDCSPSVHVDRDYAFQKHWHFKLASLARCNYTVTTSSIQARFRAKRSSIATQGRSRAHIRIRVRPAIDRSDPFSEQSVKTCNNSTPVVRYVTKLVQN